MPPVSRRRSGVRSSYRLRRGLSYATVTIGFTSSFLALVDGRALAFRSSRVPRIAAIAAVNEATESVEFYPAPRLGEAWKPVKRWRPVPGWGGGVDVKLRPGGPYGGRVLAIADGVSGYVGIYSYPGLTRKWSAHVGRGRAANLHGVEFLPDGNVAIANATGPGGGSVRLLAHKGAKVLAVRPFPGAHEVLYDPSLHVLWAIGNDRLSKFRYRAGKLGPEVSYKLPRSSAHTVRRNFPAYGHDVQPVYGRKDRLWIATNGGITQFSKTAVRRCRIVRTKVNWPRPGLDGAGFRFCNDFPGAASINAGNALQDRRASYRRLPKSIGNDPVSGRVLLTFPAPAHGYHDWTTPCVTLYSRPRWVPMSFSPNTAKTAYYRARWLVAAYQ
ncbi:hypothetical protein DZF91_27870 [Actinomadura logoneensis]|uniref:Uncharacterized protein n=1 Tax=Actinomadura logoneensis TaxID=2293572 RepID=A0A372JEG5_9ACTN|nr:DUF6528 family protein [Actinomadura logoneensis]RFU38405.1 hypothetical protein DZF91_27870 [Actinomadura logoneensis]